ncbi:MAG: hydrolase [Gammaproteobacteria bacterium]|nr:MAG: hydrolase [Gammaproteobacteria bacterium]
MPEGERSSVVSNAQVLLTAAEQLTIPVIVTEQYPKGLGPTAPELMGLLQKQQATIIEKTSFSCLQSEPFSQQLKKTERKQIVLLGMESHICILQSALALKAEGYTVHVIEDAICSRKDHHTQNSLQRMRQAGVIINNVESALFEWLGDAKHPSFRVLSKLIV